MMASLYQSGSTAGTDAGAPALAAICLSGFMTWVPGVRAATRSYSGTTTLRAWPARTARFDFRLPCGHAPATNEHGARTCRLDTRRQTDAAEEMDRRRRGWRRLGRRGSRFCAGKTHRLVGERFLQG